MQLMSCAVYGAPTLTPKTKGLTFHFLAPPFTCSLMRPVQKFCGRQTLRHSLAPLRMISIDSWTWTFNSLQIWA